MKLKVSRFINSINNLNGSDYKFRAHKAAKNRMWLMGFDPVT